jgi:WD40 repeat protein
MSELPQEFIVHNQAELEDLAWELEASAEQFSLILARCNYASLREQLVESLRQLCSLEMRVLVLNANETALYTRIQAELAATPPGALLVFGLEAVNQPEQLLSTANQVREEFRKNCPFPIVLWVTDDVQRLLVNAAPDLESWATKTHFTLPPEALNHGLQQANDRLFSALLNPASHPSLQHQHLDLDLGLFNPSEIASAVQELRSHGQELDPTLQASLDFVRGLRAENSEEALECFERSLRFWQQRNQEAGNLAANRDGLVLREGLLLFYVGQAEYALGDSESQTPDWERARRSLQNSIAKFEQANRPDCIALCVPPLERVLQKLQAWDQLEGLARRGIELHRVYGTPTRLSQDYGFLAKVALERQQWTAARDAAQQGLVELAQEPDDRLWLRGLYLLFLAQAERQLGSPEAAIAHLIEADAGAVSDRGYPRFAIRILEALRDLYFERQQYLDAFHARQERLSIEQQYGIRAFVGAGRLQPRRQAAVTEFQTPTESMVAPEIAAAGRQQDLTRLIERIGRRDYRLIVIHGNSGVGKSSLVGAGLVPTLKQKAIDVRDNLPLVMRTYTQWARELDLRLDEELRNRTGRQNNGDSDVHPTPNTLLEKLRRLDQGNLRTVLIFDQFEEFFFVYPQPEDRKPFFDFLAQCLQILSLNVVLSLREDYLHLLLEFNRLPAMAQTGIDILSRNVLYELGNFSLGDARAIVQSLTERARFFLEPALVTQLVEDLAREVGTVRPIELQVVGAQLQEEGITTLAQYRDCGREPKQELVKRYLDGVVTDCGSENRQLAELVLFLLTDEKGTRPLKTRAELEKELQSLAVRLDEKKNLLDLMLQIFVESGLVLLLPELPTDRYQLVHDYIASLIRQQQEPRLAELIIELEVERKQRYEAEVRRRQIEVKLSRILKRRLRNAYLIGATFAALLILSLSFWLSAEQGKKQVEIAEIKALNSASEARFTSNNQLEALVASVQAGQRIGDTNAPPELRTDTLDKLRQALNNIQEQNRLEGHTDFVFGVNFSPDGKILASAGADDQIKLWNRDGTLLKTVPGHNGDVWIVSFSPDGKLFASAGDDGKVKLWSRDGTLLNTLSAHQGAATSVVFSPDGKLFASAGDDGKVKLWNLNGSLLKMVEAHKNYINSLSFSSDGQLLASASSDKTVKLWRTNGTLVKTISGHTDAVWSVSFSPDGQILASASFDNTVKLWNRDGLLINTLKAHTGRVLGISFSPDGQTLASSSVDKSIIIWRRDGQLLATLRGHSIGVRAVVFSPDGETLVSAGLDKTIRFWKYLDISTVLRGHTGNLRSVSFSPDSKVVASSSVDGTMKLWSNKGDLLKSSETFTDRIVSVNFSPDGRLLAGASVDNTVKLWNLDSNIIKGLRGHSEQVWNVRFSPDGKALVSSSGDRTIRIWSRDGQPLKTLRGHQDSVNSISFSPDGQLLASGSLDKTIKLWNRKGELLRTIVADQSAISSVSLSPDGKSLASGGDDNTVKLWSLDGKLLKVLMGHQNRVLSVAFSPKSQLIASGDADGSIRLWSRAGIQLQSFQDIGSVWDLSFSPDNQFLASASDDTVAKIWKLDNQKLDALALNNLDGLLAESCNWLTNYLRTNRNARSEETNLCRGISKTS